MYITILILLLEIEYIIDFCILFYKVMYDSKPV